MKYKKLGIILLTVIAGLMLFSMKPVYTDSMDIDNNTLVISVCTGNMRGLETGISVYAGYNKVPLILSDKTLPQQLASWLPGYVRENNIDKIIVAGPVSAEELFELFSLGIPVKQVNGNSISDILTKIADNTPDKNNDAVIFTASDPLAGVLGAYTRTPVFITASNASYDSSDNLDSNYAGYIKTHNISHIIIVGQLPSSLKNQLESFNVSIEEISGSDSVELSMNVNNKLKSMGFLNNTTSVYYGFYGELPTIVPLVIQNNAMIIEDSSNRGNVTGYLGKNNISTVYLTRNKESDYIQMEEADYISSDTVNQFEENNMTVNFLTNNRTLDEATGLYDVKMITAENVQKHDRTINNTTCGQTVKSDPPLIEMLKSSSWTDSNNISVNVQRNNGDIEVKWSTIHPYTWKKVNQTGYYATSDMGYEYFWNYNENTWTVDYKYNNKSYYEVKWTENENHSWTEIQPGCNYTWTYDGEKWFCYNNDSLVIYSISKT